MKISSQSCTCSLSRLFLLNSLLYVQHVSAVSRACAYLPLELVISTSSRLARLAVAAEPRSTVMSQLAALKQASLVVDTDATDFLWPTSEKSIEAWVASLVAGGELIAFLDFLFERPVTQRNAALVPSFLLDGPWSSLHTPSVEVDKQVEASPLKPATRS